MVSNRVRAEVAGLLLAVVFGAAGQLVGQDKGDDELHELIASVEPSVVTIEVPGVGAGSGFLVGSNGVVATCYHVVEGAKTAVVKFHDGGTADVLGYVAASRGKDLILLKVSGRKPRQPLKVSAKRPQKGEAVFAFGAPKGLAGSVTDGIVSSIRKAGEIRQVLTESAGSDIYSEQLGYDLDAVWVQTSAPISAGNSGGPLVDARGEVVGVNAWFRPDGQSLNFAILGAVVGRLLDDAEDSPRPLSDLPKARTGVGAPVLADSDATTRFWAAVQKAKEARSKAQAKIATLGKNPTPIQKAKTFRELAKVWRSYADEIKAIDVNEVDVRLSGLVTTDAQSCEKVAVAFNTMAGNIENRNLADARNGVGYLAVLAQGLEKINDEYDLMRVVLSNQYSATLEPMPPSAPMFQADYEETEKRKLEDVAAHTLSVAKKFSNGRNMSAARKWLRKVIEQYPATEAAKEAQKLLDDIGDED